MRHSSSSVAERVSPAQGKRRGVLRTSLAGVALFLALIPAPGLTGAVSIAATAEFREAPSATREYATIVRHLRQPFRGYGTWDVLAPQFGIVALSHMAAGLYSVAIAEPQKRGEVEALLEEVVRRGLSKEISPRGVATRPSSPLDDHNLFWSHLGLILGIHRAVRCDGRASCADGETDRLAERIVRHLRRRSLETGLYHAPSYPGSALWPADQTVSLLAMKLFDATHGTSLHEEPLRGFLRTMQGHRDAETGLFHSSVSRLWYAAIPRGCAVSWSGLYLAQLDARAAFAQYRRAREHLRKQVLGVGGFREWPEGRGGRMDVDSGPILFGVGMAASGLGLAPARMFRDAETYTTIRRSALAFGLPAYLPSRGHHLAPLLGEAILFSGRTARPWFGAVPAVPESSPPLPLAPALFLAVDLLILVLAARSLVRALSGWMRSRRGGG
jgi:hypothetical protein